MASFCRASCSASSSSRRFLQLALFFPLHFPEGEHHFLREPSDSSKSTRTLTQRYFFAETAEKFAAEIPYSLAD